MLIDCDNCRKKFDLETSVRRERLADGVEISGMICPVCGTVYPMAALDESISERNALIAERIEQHKPYRDQVEENRVAMRELAQAHIEDFREWGPVWKMPG